MPGHRPPATRGERPPVLRLGLSHPPHCPSPPETLSRQAPDPRQKGPGGLEKGPEEAKKGRGRVVGTLTGLPSAWGQGNYIPGIFTGK